MYILSIQRTSFVNVYEGASCIVLLIERLINVSSIKYQSSINQVLLWTNTAHAAGLILTLNLNLNLNNELKLLLEFKC